ncbi:MAG: histidine kinase [Spirosomataceae bacterium]
MKRFSGSFSRFTFLLLSVAFISYLSYLLYGSLKAQFGENWQNFGGFFKFLLSYIALIGGVWLLGWLNYQGPFRWWFLSSEKRWWYWTWIVGAAWLLFELLQLRQDHDIEFVDENSLVTLVLMGIIIGFAFIADAFRVRREQLVLQQQKTEAELRALKSHINPHFLFNTLNTIYNEADTAQNETVAGLVQQLAGIMRFTLQEAAKDFTTVDREIAFLEKYLALQRARLPKRDSLRIDTDIDYDGQPARIAPLLLLPFVENAFQYGISLQQDSFIDLRLTIENNTLTFSIKNSISPQAALKRGHGTGINNVRQRLALLYPHRHQMTVEEKEAVFTVTLHLQLF